MQHEPLGKALKEYAGAKNRSALLSLLLPIQQAAEHSTLISELVDSGEVYHALAWSPREAYRFLQDIPVFEESGLVVRVPDWWKSNRPPRPAVNVKIDARKGYRTGCGRPPRVLCQPDARRRAVDRKRARQLLESVGGLVALKGKWVEVDRDKLAQALEHWKEVERDAHENGLSFYDGMRLARRCFSDSMTLPYPSNRSAIGSDYLRVARSRRRSGSCARRSAGGNIKPAGLLAQLREYQQTGVSWLRLVTGLGLGACLADDMGLGKTVQVIGLLLDRKATRSAEKPDRVQVESPRRSSFTAR